MLTVAPVSFTASRDGVEHRQVEVLLAAAARRDAADELGAVLDALLGMERALLAGETLADDPACSC